MTWEEIIKATEAGAYSVEPLRAYLLEIEDVIRYSGRFLRVFEITATCIKAQQAGDERGYKSVKFGRQSRERVELIVFRKTGCFRNV